MSLDYYWDSDQSEILHLDLSGRVTDEELRSGLRRCAQLVGSVAYRVDVILNLVQAHNFPHTILSQIATFIRDVSRNIGVIVIIGDTTYLNSLTITFAKVYPFEASKLHLESTLEHGYQTIATSRATTS